MKLTKYVALSLVALACTAAHAGSLTCAGKVKQINLHANDTFMVQLESMNYPVFFCKPNGPWSVSGTTYSMSPETCRALISIFLTAKATDKALGDVYFDGDQVPSNCTSWSPWSSALVRYFSWAE